MDRLARHPFGIWSTKQNKQLLRHFLMRKGTNSRPRSSSGIFVTTVLYSRPDTFFATRDMRSSEQKNLKSITSWISLLLIETILSPGLSPILSARLSGSTRAISSNQALLLDANIYSTYPEICVLASSVTWRNFL